MALLLVIFIDCLQSLLKPEMHLASKIIFFSDTPTWTERIAQSAGSNNKIKKPLIDLEKVILPEMHIRHGIGTQFIKKLVKDNEEATDFLKGKFKVSDAKLLGGVFNGPKFRALFKVSVTGKGIKTS